MSPYIFAVVEESMCKGGGDGCKQEAVGNGERCRKEDGAISLVSLEVEGGIRIDDLRDVILLPCVIKSVWGQHGKVSAAPNVGILQSRCSEEKKNSERQAMSSYVENGDNEPVEKCGSETHVGRSPPRGSKRDVGVGDLTPVEGENTHGQTMPDTKEMVDLGVVWSHPANPRKARESGEEIGRQEI
jgi:hypothetical protein